jgi:hypothetical protein
MIERTGRIRVVVEPRRAVAIQPRPRRVVALPPYEYDSAPRFHGELGRGRTLSVTGRYRRSQAWAFLSIGADRGSDDPSVKIINYKLRFAVPVLLGYLTPPS